MGAAALIIQEARVIGQTISLYYIKLLILRSFESKYICCTDMCLPWVTSMYIVVEVFRIAIFALFYYYLEKIIKSTIILLLLKDRLGFMFC